jgi:hypothetical protein
MADVDQARPPSRRRVRSERATAAVLDQAIAAVLDDAAHSHFGRDMVAGRAPDPPAASIMPLKAFGSDGRATRRTSSAPSSTPRTEGELDLRATHRRQGKALIACSSAR